MYRVSGRDVKLVSVRRWCFFVFLFFNVCFRKLRYSERKDLFRICSGVGFGTGRCFGFLVFLYYLGRDRFVVLEFEGGVV